MESVVGAFQAKTHFSELLQRVAEGEVITITRHGTAVARLVPIHGATNEDERRAAIDRMRVLADRNRLGDLRIKDLITAGRR